MESPGKKFTDLVEIESIQDTDLTVVRNDTGVKKTPMQKLSDYIKQKFIGWVFSDLPTTDKTITGALKELNSALEYRFFNGEEGFTEKGLSFPMSGVAILNNLAHKIDIHCAGVLESLSESDGSADFINLNSLCSHIGINTLTWNSAHNSRVIVLGEVEYSSSYDGIWGRTGLRLQKTSDYGAAICRAYTADLGSTSPWLLSIRKLYKQGNIYYIDIWGADYN